MAAPVRLASFYQMPVSSPSKLYCSGSVISHIFGQRLRRDSLGFDSFTPFQLRTDKQELYDLVDWASTWHIDWASKPHTNVETEIARYFEDFMLLSGPLVFFRYMSKTKCAELFLQGFHPDVRAKIRHILGYEVLPPPTQNCPSSVSSSPLPPLPSPLPPSPPLSSPPPSPPTPQVYELMPPPTTSSQPPPPSPSPPSQMPSSPQSPPPTELPTPQVYELMPPLPSPIAAALPDPTEAKPISHSRQMKEQSDISSTRNGDANPITK